jgi:hypothetical protein
MPDDTYVARYGDKLWQLLPALYRTLDTGETPGAAGPLRELVNRIGAQMATVRRGIDRLWENQSIETCDDWVIPYIGDLLATRMVSCLDARAQRLDVAKTIYYRRRSGTVGLLEELGADIAGRDVRVVEFFRRLGRTRHQFDPPIGPIPAPFDAAAPPIPPVVEGLAGAYSRTPAGGFADLRNRYGAANTGSAFDEFAHTADLRHGAQSSGWYNISHLGVFIWWLQSFPILAATPVSNGAAKPCFTFDPTGRDIPLFAPSSRSAESFGEHWVSPDEWQLPVAIREVLWRTVPDRLYPAAFWVGFGGGLSPAVQPRSNVLVHPERGRFSFVGTAPQGTIATAYHFGFLSEIGAGGYDERVLPEIAQPAATTTVAGGTGLDTALAGINADATIEIGDTMTYPGPTAALVLAADRNVALRAENQQRPVIRWAGAGPNTWVIQGNGKADLTLQGIWLQGADIVLQGSFDTVRLRMVTLDPGTSDAPTALFVTAIDGATLRPATLWIEGTIDKLIIERCITGPIRTRNGGAVETLAASDSIIQSIPAHAIVAGAPVLDPADLAARLKSGSDPISTQIRAALSAADRDALKAYAPGSVPSAALQAALVAALAGRDRATLEAAYPLALADLALGFANGTVSLSRCTVLGPTATHRMEASECILDEIARVEDPQHGCVRFCAYAEGSNLHAPYRSVAVPPRGPLFESRLFGGPNYAKLRRDADAAIIGPQPGDTILGGAQNGAEMAAFCLERIALKRRGLAVKYLEFMPISLTPVWIDAD